VLVQSCASSWPHTYLRHVSSACSWPHTTRQHILAAQLNNTETLHDSTTHTFDTTHPFAAFPQKRVGLGVLIKPLQVRASVWHGSCIAISVWHGSCIAISVWHGSCIAISVWHGSCIAISVWFLYCHVLAAHLHASESAADEAR
jgi:hypothetical protein